MEADEGKERRGALLTYRFNTAWCYYPSIRTNVGMLHGAGIYSTVQVSRGGGCVRSGEERTRCRPIATIFVRWDSVVAVPLTEKGDVGPKANAYCVCDQMSSVS